MCNNPADKSESEIGNNPRIASEPSTHNNPESKSELQSCNNPVKYSEPFSPNNPTQCSEPLLPNSPNSYSVTITLTQCNTINLRIKTMTTDTTTITATPPKTIPKIKKVKAVKETTISTREPATKKELRTLVASAYQTQKLRVAVGNRLVGNWKVKMGQAPSKPETTMDKDAKKILEQLRKDYKNITDGVKNFPTPEKFVADGLIDTFTELSMLEHYFGLEDVEKNNFKRIEYLLTDFPIWNTFLKPIYGIGPAIGGVLIAEIDIHKANYPTSLWRLAGLDVGWDGQGRSKQKQHLEQRQYTKKSGALGWKDSITFKPLLKTKIMGIMASSFIKCGAKNPYTAVYYEYKNRLVNHPEHKDCYIALNIDACKMHFGKDSKTGKSKVPKKIVKRSFITKYFERCVNRINSLSDVELSDTEVSKRAKSLMRDTLGPYEIFETLLDQKLCIGFTDTAEELESQIKAIGGVLRTPKEMEVYIDPDDVPEGEQSGLKTVEEFDDTPDKKGRTLYKLVNIGKTASHRNMMAYRYIAKRFLEDLYKAWRELEGLEVCAPYAEAKLGIIHGEASPGKAAK